MIGLLGVVLRGVCNGFGMDGIGFSNGKLFVRAVTGVVTELKILSIGTVKTRGTGLAHKTHAIGVTSELISSSTKF